ncbi:MAG: hypothetical protein II306_02960 [Clostridia bacterium]|nr:hypothetical protein [Clostridia bacterium]
MCEYIMSDGLITLVCLLIAVYFALCAGYILVSDIVDRSRRSRKDKLDARRYRALRERIDSELHEALKENEPAPLARRQAQK